jgi:hypothetical protein
MKLSLLIPLLACLLACSTASEDGTSVKPSHEQTTISPPPVPSATPELTTNARKFLAASSIGNVLFGNDCIFFLVQDSQIRPGTKVQLVATEDSPQKVVMALISDREDCEERIKDKTPWPTLEGYDPKMRIEQYVVDLEIPDPAHPRGYGIGVVNAHNLIKVDSDGFATGDIDGDGKLEYFRDCTSKEGLHMTVWKGRPLTGIRIWHSYFHFNYDTEPDCKLADFARSG